MTQDAVAGTSAGAAAVDVRKGAAESRVAVGEPFEPVSLEARNLGKSYGDAAILEGISFKVEGGTSVAFVSPSGSGKSTLLSMLGLLLTPTAGSVLVNGQDASALDDDAKSALRLRQFGFIFQHTQLVGSLRAVENVAVPASFSGGALPSAGERAAALLDQLGLAQRLYHYPYQLSIGQKRRVATARALLMDPPILIADEPTNDLDAASTRSVADVLFEHVQRGGILLFATHDQGLAARADRIMHLDGKTFV